MAWNNYSKSDNSVTWQKKQKQQNTWTVEKIFTSPIIILGKQLVGEVRKVRDTADPNWYDQISRSSLSIILNWAEYCGKGPGQSQPHTIAYSESLETLAAILLGPEEFQQTARPLALKLVALLREETDKQVAASLNGEIDGMDDNLRKKYGA